MPDLAFIGDLHFGSTLALWPPDFEMNDGETHQLSRVQQWLWDCWQDYLAAVPAGSIGIVNGDLIQGTNHKDSQLTSIKWIDQIDAATRGLSPFVRRCSTVYLVFGTEWHEFEAGQSVTQIYRNLERAFPGKVHRPQQELWLEWEGHRVHVAHHRSIANSPVSAGTPLAGSLVRMLAAAPARGGLIPDIVVRSHAHDPGYLRCQMGLSIGLPAWQVKTALAWKKSPERVPGIGGVVLTKIREETVVCEKLYQPAKPRPHPLSAKSSPKSRKKRAPRG